MNLLAFVAAWGLPMIGVLFVVFCVGLGYLTRDQRAHKRTMERLQHEARMEQMWNGYAAAALCTASRQSVTTMPRVVDIEYRNARQFSGWDLSKEWREEQERLREQEREQWEREKEEPEITVGAYDVTEEFNRIRRS